MNGRRWVPVTGIILLFFLAGASLHAQEEQDWRFGVIEAYTARNAARELDIGWTRLRFQWADVQAAGPDTWAPDVSDEQIDEQLAEGRELVGLLIGIPDWARDEAGLPSGLWLAHNDPDNTWGTFVRDIVSRYDGRIDHWIIWNEPDIAATEVAHSWDGSVDDFYQLQRVAYLAAKEANPDAVIHLAAFTYWADYDAGSEQYMARLLDRILADPEAAGHNYYFDIATAHLYFQPDQVYDLLGVFQEMMAGRGLPRPIWLVETNAPPYDDPDWPVAEPALAVSSTEQAAYIPQAVAAALAGGADRIAVYKLRDTEGDRAANPEPFGLLRLDGSRRVAYTTYREAIRFMRGTTSAARERWDEVGQFRLEQDDRITTVLFSRLPQPQQVEVEAIAGSARLVDMWGQEEVIEAQNGRYTIDLQQALCTQTIGDYCMIGGTVMYLIEARDGGPPPLDPPPLAPLPTIIPTPLPTATETPFPAASPTPPSTAAPAPSATSTAGSSPAAATKTATASAASIAAAQEPDSQPDPATLATAVPAQNAAAETQPSVPPSFLLLTLAAVLGAALLLYLAIRARRRP
ncbi:MAG: hypothetical protein ACK2UT_04790 [Candidatus Promineifilaceae bacterium]